MSEEIKMNLFQKLQEARVRLQDLNVKKSGQNSFAKYSYYELGDILPAINNIIGGGVISNLIQSMVAIKKEAAATVQRFLI